MVVGESMVAWWDGSLMPRDLKIVRYEDAAVDYQAFTVRMYCAPALMLCGYTAHSRNFMQIHSLKIEEYAESLSESR